MTITAAAVLFAVIWFMALFIALPIGLRTQGDEGEEIVRGTHASSPVNPNIKKKMFWVTVVTVVLWVPLVFLINSGLISHEVFNFYGGIDNSY